MLYNTQCPYETLYAYFLSITGKTSDANLRDEYYQGEFNLNEVEDLKDYPVLRHFQEEIHNKNGKWDLMICLISLIMKHPGELDLVHDLMVSERSYQIPKTQSELIKYKNNYYWAEFVIDTTPWKYHYEFLKKYPRKADILVFCNQTQFLMHSLNKEVIFKDETYKYHLLGDKCFSDVITFDSAKLFQFTTKELPYKKTKVNIYVNDNVLMDDSLKIMVEDDIMTFLKKKFHKYDIIILTLENYYVLIFNEFCSHMPKELSILFRIGDKTMMRMDKYVIQKKNTLDFDSENNVTKTLKPLNDIIDYINHAFTFLTQKDGITPKPNDNEEELDD